ncbi:ABC transporter permease [Vibrio genomosp. F10 str. 9ZC157]|uniref:Transport permease protein n=1 Tax=Vibrio genomosp. F10 str. ZF-129 TaxID=1187848 RepID=A0A1E5BDD7_9VIBR|nr:ABC transporter permease [Vibrio genomosp. F10]OEE33116.1 teichoic acid ABC transporter permease [Vibrio genomosp. F10 str. ZF-129]OEE95617.1 teichoic acid ABC transporter permease [Vibrio genomosp. F10 str. 9ZC157]
MYQLPFLFIRDIFRSRELLVAMTKRDIENRYLGSLFGGGWAFVQPLVTILVMWFVFQVGFKAQPTSDGIPFTLWLISGMIPWFFFAEALSNATSSITEQANIVKKIVFKVSLLPIVKILSALIIHIFFIGVLLSVSIAYGFYPKMNWVQIPYFLFCAGVLLLGISWITSSVIIFFRDVGQVIAVFIQLGFWGTPIFWSIGMIPEKYQWIFKLNPVFYITEGYRNSLTTDVWFWQSTSWSFYFWGTTLTILVLGSICFKKLRPHFADVL